MKCERCGIETNTFKMSYLNSEMICMDCVDNEKYHPVYEFARKIEKQEVKAGNYNFPGVLEGLSYHTKDEANLLARLKYGDNPNEIYKAWDTVLNNMLYRPNKFAELIIANEIDYKEEAASWIAYMATTKRIDGRNEASQKACKEINVGTPLPTPLVELMSNNHRTLQQEYTATMLTIYTNNPTYLPFI